MQGISPRLALITGSRNWPARLYSTIWEDCHTADALILGDCPTGADLWARRFAEFYQRPHAVYKADWHRYRGNAGPRRNAEMVATAAQNLGAVQAFAYYVPWAKNIGTRDCHQKCMKATIPVTRRDAR